ncbi:DUF2332 domain-containing protein [Aestuariibius sp. HNIBRBA575]|uniref:DUF2332 domain-containing protein n=1 Tax=Aestuariibius sp. HNIBRBA575 TaxID=3233343 RepID=UPI0034A5566C
MTDRLRAAFRWQAGACRDLGSPFMGQLCDVLAQRLQPGTALTDRMFDWPGDLSPKSESVPLRLCGALHALRLSGRAGLEQVYPPHHVSDDELWQAIEKTLISEAGFVDDFINSPPQTNEVRRQCALIAMGHFLTQTYDLPIVLSELGASAGLNLTWDRSTLIAGDAQLGPDKPVMVLRPEWTGTPPTGPHPNVVERRGVDLNPLDPHADSLRLRAYLWPDQPERLTLTAAAIDAAEGHVDRADAIDWIEQRLTPRTGHLHLIYSTIAWQYFPKASQTRGTDLIEAAGAKATTETPLAWFAMEPDDQKPGEQKPGAAMTLRLWPGDLRFDLGRVDFHGRWIHWDPQQH